MLTMWRFYPIFRCRIKFLPVQRRCIHYIKRSKLYQPVSPVMKGTDVMKKGEAISKSQQLMMTYGLLHHGALGTYYLLPLAVRSLHKLIAIIEKYMNDIGAQQIDIPNLSLAQHWKKTGRWDEMGSELFKLKDRQGKDLCLGPTQEEAIVSMVKSQLVMPEKDLPILLYQINKKFRDEPRPRYGLLRAREFLMKDLYSFNASPESATETYKLVSQAYENIFTHLGVDYKVVQASTGAMGGSLSHEFHFINDIGEDTILLCTKCNYGVNSELKGLQDSSQCANCGGDLYEKKSIEVGHTFLLGTKYTSVFNSNYINKSGKQELLHMGCFGVGVTRLLAAAVEVLSTLEDIRWPAAIAPYTVCIVPPKTGSKEFTALSLLAPLVEQLSAECHIAGDVIVDDRDDLTIGRRVLDAKHTGYPFIIVIGKNALGPDPKLEMFLVNEGQRLYVSPGDVGSLLREKIQK